MENKKLTRIQYSKSDDAYRLEMSRNGGFSWELVCSCEFRRREGAAPNEDTSFIHYGIIQKLQQLTDLGYTFTA